MSKVALITGVTGQDGSYWQNCCWKKGMKFTVLSVVPLHSTPSVSITFTGIRMRQTRNSICTTAT